jgi:hypothetical protein
MLSRRRTSVRALLVAARRRWDAKRSEDQDEASIGSRTIGSCGSIGSAQAAVITFEDLPVDPPGTFDGDRISGGFFFDSPTNHTHVDDGTNWGADNGTTIMVIDAFGADNDIIFSQIGGGPFALTGIDLSRANT